MEQRPAVGRIVHFHGSPAASPEAAIIIHVWSDTCINVSKCNSGGTWSMESSVLLEGPHVGGSFWRWPPRV